MEQQTQYLYEYQDGKRVRNIGFMKIEQKMDKCMICIYASQLDDVKGIVFWKDNGEKYIGGWEKELLELEERPLQVAYVEERMERQADITKPKVEVMEEEESDIDDYIPPRNVTYEKIQRQDLSKLPRREWKLANNSFLLHGFYNYHHLLYIEDEGEIWIGVPGIYHEKEEFAAKSYGFPEFRRILDVDLKLEEHEKNTYEDFGYWCRQIPIS